MSIERTTFTGNSKLEQWDQISTWMQENASDLFNSIEINNESKIIYCNKIEGTNNGAFMVCPNSTTLMCQVTIPKLDGTYATLYMPTSTNSTTFDYAVKTSKGICIHWTFSGQPNSVFISKSTNNTTFAFFSFYMANTSSGFVGCCDLETAEGDASNNTILLWLSAQSFYLTNKMTSMQTNLTALNPVASPTNNEYCPHILQMHFNQYKGSTGIITLNDKQYFTDGYYALAD